MTTMSYSNYDDEYSVEEQFEKIYPQYDHSLESTYREKDMRKRKRMKTM